MIFFYLPKPVPIQLVICSKVQMQHNLYLRFRLPHRLNPGCKKSHHSLCIFCSAFRPQKTICNLISHLHICWQVPVSLQFLKCIFCIFINSFFQFFFLKPLPLLWFYLLCRISPEITVMKVQHRCYFLIRCSLCQFHYRL